jgi:hypothetical protein
MEENQKIDNSLKNPASPNVTYQQTNTITPEDKVVSLPEESYYSWSAPEFIENKKSLIWFLGLVLTIITISFAVLFIVHSYFAVVMTVLIGIAFAVIAGRPPKIINYDITNKGFQIGKRFISYNQFKSFSILDEPSLGSIVFNPLKRFSFPTTIYYELPDKEKIVNAIQEFLPNTPLADDPVDQLMRRIRF